MRIFIKHVAILLLIIILGCIAAYYAYHMGQNNGHDKGYSEGYADARQKAESFNLIPHNNEMNTLVGVVTSIQGEKLTIKMTSLNPFLPDEYWVRTVNTSANTLVEEFVVPEIQIIDPALLGTSTTPPQVGLEKNENIVTTSPTLSKKTISIQNLAIGDMISVDAGTNVANIMEFDAKSILKVPVPPQGNITPR